MKRLAFAPLLVLALGLVFVVACAGEKVVETVVVEKAVPGEKVVETVIVEKIVVATPTPTRAAPPSKTVPSGTVTAAIGDIGFPAGTPALCAAGCGTKKHQTSGFETLLGVDATESLVGVVAESWEVAPDGSSYTWNIRPGIQFHQGWGELTAEDVAFTLNNANSATNPDSIHDQAGTLASHIGETRVVDRYTAVTEITGQDVRQPTYLFSGFWESVGMSSKAVFDQFGTEGMRDVLVGTGPFEITEWMKANRLVLEAVPDHWRKTPAVKTIKVLEVPEPTVRVAMFETGEAQVADVPLKDVGRLAAQGGAKAIRMQSQQLGLMMFGNYLEKVSFRTGEEVSNPGFDPSLPWVGDPDAPGCDRDVLSKVVPDGVDSWEDQGELCDELNDARKVRLALSMSVDREGIAEALFYGLAKPAYLGRLPIDNPLFRDEWVMPFDPERSRELMAEAGYADGFQADFWVGPDAATQRLGETIAATWKQELDVDVEFDRRAYPIVRPGRVDRSDTSITLNAYGGYTHFPVDWPQGVEGTLRHEGGSIQAGTLPFFSITEGRMMEEPDKDKRLQYAEEFFEHNFFWRWNFRTIEKPVFHIFNGDDLTWDRQLITRRPELFFPLEDIAFK